MSRLLIAGGVLVVAVVVAWLLGRRRADPPTQDRHQVPTMLDRREFPGSDAPWLIAVFTSLTCASCAAASAAMAALARNEVAYVEVPWQQARALHERYGIESVPLVLITNQEGVVQASCEGAAPSDLVALAHALDALMGSSGARRPTTITPATPEE